MSLFVYDTFADVSGTELTSHVGQFGATYTRHPSTSTSTFNWWISDEGRAYSTADTSSAPLAAHYLVEGVSDDDEYDVIAVWNLKSFLSDSYHGLTFRYDSTTDTGYKLSYWSYTAFRKWVLQRIDAGVATEIGSYTITPSVGSDTTIRIELRTTGIVVKFDGVTQITSSDTTIQVAGRVGLYGIGNPPASPTAGMHVSRLAVTSPGHVLPDYDLTGPAVGMPLVASDVFTVSLADGVNPGSVTVTPTLTGTLAGTISPTSVVLADADRTKTFTFTPSGSVSGTIVVTDSAALADPPAVDFASGFFEPENLSGWESHLHDRHNTGAFPYVPEGALWLDGSEHYDVIQCMQNARDWCVREGVTPTDWSVEIAAAIARYRDLGVIGLGSVQPHHVNGYGLARHYFETGDTVSLTALGIILAASGGPDSYYETNKHMGSVREVALKGLAADDQEASGLGSHGLRDATIRVHLTQIDQWTAPPGTYFGTWTKLFMVGIALRNMIAYWDRYRGASTPALRVSNLAAIPAAVKAMIDFTWDELWISASAAVPYNVPDMTVECQPVSGTIAASTSPGVFTITGDLSTVDNFYKFSNFRFDDRLLSSAGEPPYTDQDYDHYQIETYNGTTGAVTLTTTYLPGFTPTVGEPITITSPEAEIDAGPGAAPSLNHMFAPACAWYYWYERVVQADLAAAMPYRDRFHRMFDGGDQTTAVTSAQKQWNQSLFWIPWGLKWVERGDADEWPAATTFSLQAPATGAAGSHSVASGPFRLSVADGVSLDGPVTVTPASSTGLGTFNPSTAILTTDRPWAVFHFTPASADDTSTVNISATATGLTAPAPVAYAVGTQAAVAYVYLINSPAGGILMLNAPAP